ncbi:hypothetical protein [Lactobacillus sp. ESL0261]|uniref:hypothetical protein n=1 Tax=Lactobacillus sp. ESL0261 TaxID=2069348 RepID=UPI000EFCC80D|nr:hypothetical protein [Lactobacillus sp. ESL0261]RMC55113.1 hypothetical protein F5ESL0261_04290 [Lactobacillus sp. ESL0261]
MSDLTNDIIFYDEDGSNRTEYSNILIEYILNQSDENDNVLPEEIDKIINTLNTPSGLWEIYQTIIERRKKNPESFQTWDEFDEKDSINKEILNGYINNNLFTTYEVNNTQSSNSQTSSTQSNNSQPLNPPLHTVSSFSIGTNSKNLKNLFKIRNSYNDFYYKLKFVNQLAKEHDLNYEGANQQKKINNRFKKRTQIEIDEVTNHVANSIYPVLITILGIFTAITFSIFGGIVTINSISSNLKISSKNPQNLGNLLIGAAVLGLLLFGNITVLFAGISKVTKRDFKLPLLLNIIVLATLTVMFLIGYIFIFTVNGKWQWNKNIVPLPSGISCIGVVLLVYIGIFIFYKIYRHKIFKQK